jgi:hypothetical protein
MSTLLCPCLLFLLPLLPVRLRSLLGRVFPPFFALRLCFAPTDFHVQLSYRSRTSAWDSRFSNIDHALNSKSYSSAFLRSA